MPRLAVLVLSGILVAVTTAALAWSAAAALQQAEPEVRRGQSVTICHAKGNGDYVQNSPDADSIVSDTGARRTPRRHHPALPVRAEARRVGQLPGPELALRRADLEQRLRRPRSARTTRSEPAGAQDRGRRRRVAVELLLLRRRPTIPFEADGENELQLPAGTYTVSEVAAPPGYKTTFSGCTNIVLASPQSVVPVCTITNTPPLRRHRRS